MANKKNKINKWLLWGVIVLAVLLVLWLTCAEYFYSSYEGDVMRTGAQIEQTQGE